MAGQKYVVWYEIGNQTQKPKQVLTEEEITKAAKQGWLKLENGNIVPWGKIQILQFVKPSSFSLMEESKGDA